MLRHDKELVRLQAVERVTDVDPAGRARDEPWQATSNDERKVRASAFPLAVLERDAGTWERLDQNG